MPIVYLQIPGTHESWKSVTDGFYTGWNFPNCVGAIDRKHIAIRLPPKSGSYYYNYEGNIVLLAVSDANSDFIYVDVGRNGRVSDGGVGISVISICALKMEPRVCHWISCFLGVRGHCHLSS